jgi:transposase
MSLIDRPQPLVVARTARCTAVFFGIGDAFAGKAFLNEMASSGARFGAVIVTAAMNESDKSAWCREHGVYPVELDQWRASCANALADPEEARASPQATRAASKRIKELEREVRRKDRALAETAALLVLSKKVEAIFHRDEDA